MEDLIEFKHFSNQDLFLHFYQLSWLHCVVFVFEGSEGGLEVYVYTFVYICFILFVRIIEHCTVLLYYFKI